MFLSKNIKVSKGGLVLLTVVLIIVSKIFQFNFLSEKYFYDSSAILAYTNHIPKNLDGSYRFAAWLFGKINIFHFATLSQWAIGFAVVFGVILCRFIKKESGKIDILTSVYLIASIFLIGIYVLNISKDVIQLAIFFIVYLLASNRIVKNNYIKVAFCSVAFLIESQIFRRYYVLMAVFCPLLFYMLGGNRYGEKREVLKREESKGILRIIILIIIILFIFMILARSYLPEEYEQLTTIRAVVNFNREKSIDAKTLILDVYDINGNLFIWFVNYIINAVRMLFPLELIFKGVKYWAFVVYQIMITYYILREMKRFNELNSRIQILFCIAVAFILVSFMFEPDFGSWIRHESAAFPILFPIVMNRKFYRKNYFKANIHE